MSKRFLFLLFIAVIVGVGIYFASVYKTPPKNTASENTASTKDNIAAAITAEYPLSIPYMRKQTYPGSDIVIEETLTPGVNYKRYVVSYRSDGLKIYALLTIPNGTPPKSGWPVIVFNHGYIPPEEYRTTERYIAYTDAFSRNGYIVFKSDYRGHGSSEGRPEGGYYSPAYTIDVLNGLASVKRLNNKLPEELSSVTSSEPLVDVNRIGMWGHSMGGSLTLRSMVIDKEIKAGVIWAGVVANYEDLATNWHRATPFQPSEREQQARRGNGRQNLIDKYGTFTTNKAFWDAIAPISYVKDLTAPIQIHHGTEDEEVPLLFSQRLDDAMKQNGKTVEFYTYEGADHNISQYVDQALQRSVDFFNKYVKGE